MKVKELIKALSEQPQDAEVFFLTEGLIEVTAVKSASAGSDEMKEITGEDFVMLK